MRKRRAVEGSPVIPLDVLERRPFGRSTCFLCGRRLGKLSRSEEDVFPLWLQKRFRISRKEITLLNGTTLEYRKLKIPCCRDCNNVHLSKVEKAVCEATIEGVEAVRRLSQLELHTWLGKIFYGILYREHHLKRALRSPKKTPIVSREDLQTLPMLHYSLQSARVPFQLHAAQPEVREVSNNPLSSLFVFEVQRPPAVEHHFHFRDYHRPLAASILLGNVGIIAAFGDGGATRALMDEWVKPLTEYPIHPLQFLELEGRIIYQALLFDRVPKYSIIETSHQVTVIGAPLQGLSSRPLFREAPPETFAQAVATAIGLPVEVIHPRPNQFRTYLFDEANRPIQFTLRDQPWPPT